MSKADLSTLTPEQLMEMAKNPIKKEIEKNLSPVKNFIVSEGLSSGEDRIPGIVIYDRYTRWCKNNSITKLSIAMFFNEFKYHFTKKRYQDGIYYLLNPEGFDLSPATHQRLASEYGKRISSGKKKKAKKEKSND